MADRGPQGVDVIVGELCGSYKLYLPTARLDYGNKATSVISDYGLWRSDVICRLAGQLFTLYTSHIDV